MTGSRIRRCAVGLLVCLVATGSEAAQVLSVQATRRGAAVSISLRVALDAPAPKVFRALRQYAAMGRYEPDLRALRIEPTTDPNRVRLFLTLHTCVLLFCKTIRQEQIMTTRTQADGGVLQAQFVPTRGGFRGDGRWVVAPCPASADKACMQVHIELVPLFWVPPMIGPWLIRKKMDQQALYISAGLEQLARRSGR